MVVFRTAVRSVRAAAWPRARFSRPSLAPPPQTEVRDAPPDADGVAEFCADPAFARYCAAGQVRLLSVNETESVGPAMARYFASKLWMGESYFMQVGPSRGVVRFRSFRPHPKQRA